MKSFGIGVLAFFLYLASLASLIFTLQFLMPGVARNSQYETISCPNMLILSTLNEKEKPVGEENIARYSCRFWSGSGFYASPTHYIPPLRMLALLSTTAIIGFVWWVARRKKPHKSTNIQIAITIWTELVIVSAIGIPLIMNSWDTKEEYLGVRCSVFNAFTGPSEKLLKPTDYRYQHYKQMKDDLTYLGLNEKPAENEELVDGPNPTCVSLRRIGWISTISLFVITLTRWTYIILGMRKSRKADIKVSI